MNEISPAAPVDLAIEGMTCAACVRRVEGALSSVPGVTAASVNLANRRARVSGKAPLEALLRAVDAVGYRAAPAPQDRAGEAAVTPGTEDSAPSTRRTQAAQVMPSIARSTGVPGEISFMARIWTFQY